MEYIIHVDDCMSRWMIHPLKQKNTPTNINIIKGNCLEIWIRGSLNCENCEKYKQGSNVYSFEAVFRIKPQMGIRSIMMRALSS